MSSCLKVTEELSLVLVDVCGTSFISEFRKKRNDNLGRCLEKHGDLGCCMSGEGLVVEV